MFFQLAFYERERELSAINWNVQLGQDPGQSADVVLVPMGEENGANFIAILEQVGDVRDYDVYAEQLRFGKHESCIDDDDVIGPAQGHTVHAEFAQPA